MTFSLEDVRLDGCILEPSSPKAYRVRFQEKPLPTKVDLRLYCTPVENQGRIGSCTANATVGALEYHLMRRDGRSPDLSRLFVYYNSRQMQGDVFQDSGATIPQAMASVLAFGACREEIWPYDPAVFSKHPTPEAYADARQYEAIHYARVDNGNRALQALAEELPVVFATWLPQRCYQEAAQTGIIPEPTEAERRARPTGGHAMLIVGYDRHEEMFLVRNSWGEEWGDKGYCKIPFDVLEYFSPPDQFWVLSDLEKPANVTLVRPEAEQAGTPAATAAAPEMKLGGMAETAARMREQIRAGLDADIGAANARIDALLGRGSLGTPPAGSQDVNSSLCSMCGGTGRCYYCRGTGEYSPGTACLRCNGSGKCYPCNGTGVIA